MHPEEAADERQRLERLALSDCSAAAEARVDSVIVRGRRAVVNLLVNGDYEYCVHFLRDRRGQSQDAGSSSGHADRSVLDGSVLDGSVLDGSVLDGSLLDGSFPSW